MGADDAVVIAEIAIDGSQVEYHVVESSDAAQPRIDINIHEIKIVIPENGSLSVWIPA